MTGGGEFRNPLYGSPFADPFALRWNGRYYAYGTPMTGGLPVLTSTDLVTWAPAGEAIGPPPPELAHWAPEAAYDNGRFYIYWSTGRAEGEGHQLRVAAGASPIGPFDVDLGLLDPADPFTIDAHPFRDDDGQWYLFYSRDFLEGEPVGTGIVVDRLVGMTSLAGERATVVRPHAQWHLYERRRRWYDRVWDWYTVEGPFVRKHDGRYWCFYSGGAWKADNYGIGSAVADDPMGPYEPVVAGNAADLLRTVPGKVIGPGHGSVVLAPDNVTEYLLYHAWDLGHTGRFMHADRLTWDGDRPGSPGPLVDPQPRPPEPLLRDLFDRRRRADDRWRPGEGWELTAGQLRHGGAGRAAAVLDLVTPASYCFEANLAMPAGGAGSGRAGVVTGYRDDGNHAAVVVDPTSGDVRWRACRDGEEAGSGRLASLRPDFDSAAFHQLLLHRAGDSVHVTLDGVAIGDLPVPTPAGGAVGVWTADAAVVVEGVALTGLPWARRVQRAPAMGRAGSWR